MARHDPLCDPRIADALETLCRHGCQAARGIIKELERGKERPEVAHLQRREREAVLRELKAVMAVYGSCPVK